MSIESDAASQVANIYVQGLQTGAQVAIKLGEATYKLTGLTLKGIKALIEFIAKALRQKGGKHSIATMLMRSAEEGKTLKIVSLKNTEQIEKVAEEFKRYGIPFHAVKGKDSSGNNCCDIMFFEEDAPRINFVFEKIGINLADVENVTEATAEQTSGKTDPVEDMNIEQSSEKTDSAKDTKAKDTNTEQSANADKEPAEEAAKERTNNGNISLAEDDAEPDIEEIMDETAPTDESTNYEQNYPFMADPKVEDDYEKIMNKSGENKVPTQDREEAKSEVRSEKKSGKENIRSKTSSREKIKAKKAERAETAAKEPAKAAETAKSIQPEVKTK